MPNAVYEIFKDDAGLWRWRLRAANGEIVATSESYATLDNAERGVADAQSAAVDGSTHPVEHVEH